GESEVNQRVPGLLDSSIPKDRGHAPVPLPPALASRTRFGLDRSIRRFVRLGRGLGLFQPQPFHRCLPTSLRSLADRFQVDRKTLLKSLKISTATAEPP